jgi:septin family protein
MNNIANISAFENLQNQANTTMGYPLADGNSVFNATFIEAKKDLTNEEKTLIKKQEDAILAAEKKFRTADNQYMQEIANLKQKLKQVVARRLHEAAAFDKGKASLEAPLKPVGVRVVWDEPQVDKTSIDVFG